jgi:hypothetical protein
MDTVQRCLENLGNDYRWLTPRSKAKSKKMGKAALGGGLEGAKAEIAYFRLSAETALTMPEL